MTLRRSLSIQLVLWVITIVFALIAAARLPDQVPIHWGLSGKPDAWGSKWFNVCLGPGLVGMILLLTLIIPLFGRSRTTLQRSMDGFARSMVLTSALMTSLSLVILHASANETFDAGRPLFAIVFGFLAAFGTVFPKLKRNPYAGIRTKWTLSSDAVWDQTHRASGNWWLFGGIAGALAALIGMPIWLLIIEIVVLGFVPIYLSYAIYRRGGPTAH